MNIVKIQGKPSPQNLSWDRIEQLALLNPIIYNGVGQYRAGKVSKRQALIAMVDVLTQQNEDLKERLKAEKMRL